MDTDSSNELDRCLASMDEHQLRILHGRIVERLHSFHARDEWEQLRCFRELDRVWFENKGGRHTGTVMKINRRTASLRMDDGSRWNVSPNFLHRIEEDFIDATVVDKDEKQPPQDVWKDLLRYLPAGNRGRGKG